MLFSELAPDPLGGWGTLILQGGSFVLLTYIVTILVPKGMRESRDERETRDDKFLTALLKKEESSKESITTLHQQFEIRNQQIVLALREQTETLGETLEREVGKVQAAVSSVCRQINK